MTLVDDVVPAQDDDAERALLGALLIDPSIAPRVLRELDGADFWQPAHETIWNAIQRIAADPTSALDPISLKDHLDRTGELQRVGGAPYLHTLMESCPIPGNVSHYAAMVRNAARIRMIAQTAIKLKAIADKADPDLVDEALARAVDTLDAAATRFGPSSSGITVHAHRSRGGAFILDTPDHVPILWGTGTDILWAEGESLMVVGPQGVGKSTVIQQLVRARLGLGNPEVLGYPVTPTAGRVLYLACDRPSQIRRSMRRMFSEDDRTVLDERLEVWTGPPPRDLAKHTDQLATMCREAGADTVVVDSLKDVALGLKEDEVGAAYNRARQTAIEAGIQVIDAHHQTKRGAGGQGKPNTLADVYGSGWLTAGVGSVLLLWGSAGDPIVELSHLKQPADSVGPLRILHDHEHGTSTVWHATDLLAIARATPTGLTARNAASAIFATDQPTPAQVEKARRRLESMAKQGLLRKYDGDPTTGSAAAYHPADQLPIGLAQ